MLCIICNENPEKSWPKRWQCWRDNGKFSEALCKLLGLPIFPYKTDFQNCQYCLPCQKRVYNVYLIVRKWEKLQDDIDKLKSRLKKDFQQSLQKGGGSERGSVYSGGFDSSGEYERDSKEETVVLIRKRILRRMERKPLDCECCYEPERKLPPKQTGSGSQCGFPDCQDKDCKYKRKRQGKGNGYDKEASDSSESDWSSSDSHEGGECSDSFCKICSEADQQRCREGRSQNSGNHKKDPCSSEFCADCSICKDEARKTKEVEECKKYPRQAKIEVRDEKSLDNNDVAGSDMEMCRKDGNRATNVLQDTDIHDTFKLLLAKKIKERDSPVSCSDSPIIKKERPDLDEATTQSANDEDENESCGDTYSGKNDASARFRCNRMNCTRTFLTPEELDIHVRRYHEGVKFPYECKQCNKAFQWRRELNAHILKHSGEVAICCHLCGRGFRTQQLFNVHIKTKHGGERKFKCSMCDKSFISESKLNTHLTIHTKVYPFMCTTCGKGFSAKTFLKFHMSKHMDANPYQCKTCGKTFSSPRNLTVHQYTHTNTHPFKCNVCQAGATSETMLKKHMLKHDAEKANTCLICNKKFRFPSSLKKHQKVHNGEKHFLCEFCNKTFIDKYKLTRHLRTHSGDKPFICTTCKRSFATKEYLNKHIQKNHGALTLEKLDVVPPSSLLEPTMELPPIPGTDDLQLPEINESLKAYLPDGFQMDRSFLDTFNPADEGLVVTALDLENFSKDELRMTEYKPGGAIPPQNISRVNAVPNLTVLPEFPTMRTNTVSEEREFQTFTFQQL